MNDRRFGRRGGRVPDIGDGMGRPSTDAILSSILRLHAPVLLCIAAFLILGQLLQLSSFPQMTGVETACVLSSIVCYSALLTGAAALAGGALRSAAVWMLLVAASTFYLFDHYSYSWLSAHLDETVPLLIQSARTDFQVMRSKMAAMVVTAIGYVLFLIGGTVAIRYGRQRFAWWSWPVPARRVVTFVLAAAAPVVIDRAASPHLMGLEAYEAKNQVLWQVGVFRPAHPHPRQAILYIESPRFRQVPDEETVAATLATLTPADVQRPLKIFLFVVDSLREDVITEDIAPNLYRLKQASLPVEAGVASSNSTHISWFSIAHATNPLYWSVAAHQEHSRGAVPMRLLKQCGYRLHVLSCPSLEYFSFGRSVFGDSPPLATSIVDQRTLLDRETDTGAGDVDDKVMGRLGRDVETLGPDSRTFYLVMLDSTHHDYSWSKRYHPRYTPFTEYVSVFKTNPRDIEPLRNRYKNAVNFVDMLIGEFIRKLEARGLMDHSIIVVTGDHGEEFLEMGNLVHGSQLNRFQTRVPIVIYTPPDVRRQAAAAAVPRASHIDIFPTVFDAIGLGKPSHALLDGQSLLREHANAVEFCAMASGHPPSRVLLDRGDYKLIAEFDGIGRVGRTVYARRLIAAKVLNEKDEEVTPGKTPGVPSVEQLRTLFQPALDEILENR